MSVSNVTGPKRGDRVKSNQRDGILEVVAVNAPMQAANIRADGSWANAYLPERRARSIEGGFTLQRFLDAILCWPMFVKFPHKLFSMFSVRPPRYLHRFAVVELTKDIETG